MTSKPSNGAANKGDGLRSAMVEAVLKEQPEIVLADFYKLLREFADDLENHVNWGSTLLSDYQRRKRT